MMKKNDGTTVKDYTFLKEKKSEPANKLNITKKHRKRVLIVKERDLITGTILLVASVSMIFIGLFLALQDSKNLKLWMGLFVGSAIPVIIISVFFFRSVIIYIDNNFIKKTDRLGRTVSFSWNKIYSIALVQGVPGDLSVTALAFWYKTKIGLKHMTFLSTDDLNLKNFVKTVSKIKRLAKYKKKAFFDRNNLLTLFIQNI